MDRLKVCVFATKVPYLNLLLAPLLKGYYVVSSYRMSKTKRGMGREMTRRQHHVPLIPEKDSDGVCRILRIRVVVQSYHHPAAIVYVCVIYGREGICGKR